VENKSPLIIKRNSEFVFLKQNGRRLWPTKWLLLNYRKNDLQELRFGVTVSRKVGSAVVRNKIKRWCREYFRDFLKSGNSLEIDINIICKPIDQGFYKGLSYAEFSKALDRGLGQLANSLREKS
jgi:ribonuclease P protein component